jgi:hypothetical protein
VDQVRPLVPPASCALPVTSRCRFRLTSMHALNLDTLDEEAALDLLCTIAPRIGDCAAELCGYLPMALELAASALAELVDLIPADYTRRFRNERKRLKLVDASLRLSYNLVGELLRDHNSCCRKSASRVEPISLWAFPFSAADISPVRERSGAAVSALTG